jgi:hypothetical protein
MMTRSSSAGTLLSWRWAEPSCAWHPAKVVRTGTAGSLVPTTIAGHPYWAVEDPSARKMQRIQFHKNMAMIGGLLLAVLDEP